jgi:hypothetical protein
VKVCDYCNRNFLAIKNSIVSCSRFCSNQKKANRVELSCSWCGGKILKALSKLNGSKSGLYFCQRKCKDEAQKIEGLTEIHPSHYQNGASACSNTRKCNRLES